MHRPQQFSLSSSSNEEASFFGQVIPAFPSSRTSDSRMPLQMQMYMVSCIFLDNSIMIIILNFKLVYYEAFALSREEYIYLTI